MKIEITEKGLYMATKDGEQEVAVGTVIECEKFPDYMAGKARILENSADKALTTGEDIDALRARYEAVTGNKAQANMKPETMLAKIEAATKK